MNTLPTVLTASEARSNLYDMLDDIQKYFKRFVITHHGKPQAIIIPIDEAEEWEETLEILSDKKLMRSIHQAEKDRKAGRVYPLKDVLKELKLNES